MISYLKGLLSELTPTSVIVECAGVGYLVHISLTTYSALQGKAEARVLTTPIIREDAHLLYGFASEDERQLFGLLTSVSGIGPNTARVILSQYNPTELNTILALGQVEPLKAVKGIGLKTAQRIVLELKGKLQLGEVAPAHSALLAQPMATMSQTQDEAIGALKMLGYPEAAASKVVKQILSTDPTSPVEQIIKQALKLL